MTRRTLFARDWPNYNDRRDSADKSGYRAPYPTAREEILGWACLAVLWLAVLLWASA